MFPREEEPKALADAKDLVTRTTKILTQINEKKLFESPGFPEKVSVALGEGMGVKFKRGQTVDAALKELVQTVDAATRKSSTKGTKAAMEVAKVAVDAMWTLVMKEEEEEVDMDALKGSLDSLAAFAKPVGLTLKDLADATGDLVKLPKPVTLDKLVAALASLGEANAKEATGLMQSHILDAIKKGPKKPPTPKKSGSKKKGGKKGKKEEEEEEEESEGESEKEGSESEEEDTGVKRAKDVSASRKLASDALEVAKKMGTLISEDPTKLAGCMQAVRTLLLTVAPEYQMGGNPEVEVVGAGLRVVSLDRLILAPLLPGFGGDTALATVLHDPRLLTVLEGPLKTAVVKETAKWFDKGEAFTELTGTLPAWAAMRLLKGMGMSPHMTLLQWAQLSPEKRGKVPSNHGMALSLLMSVRKSLTAVENKARGAPVAPGLLGLHGQFAYDCMQFMTHAVTYTALGGAQESGVMGRRGAVRSPIPYPFLYVLALGAMAGGLCITAFTQSMVVAVQNGTFFPEPRTP